MNFKFLILTVLAFLANYFNIFFQAKARDIEAKAVLKKEA